jgi:hypothetical protein
MSLTKAENDAAFEKDVAMANVNCVFKEFANTNVYLGYKINVLLIQSAFCFELMKKLF